MINQTGQFISGEELSPIAGCQFQIVDPEGKDYKKLEDRELKIGKRQVLRFAEEGDFGRHDYATAALADWAVRFTTRPAPCAIAISNASSARLITSVTMSTGSNCCRTTASASPALEASGLSEMHTSPTSFRNFSAAINASFSGVSPSTIATVVISWLNAKSFCRMLAAIICPICCIAASTAFS